MSASAALLGALLIAAPSHAATGPGRSLATAMRLARARGHHILIKVSAVWCAPCRALDRNLAASSRARAALASYVRVAVDAERGEGAQIAKRYNVITFPTVLLLDARGREIGRVSRVVDAMKLVRAVKRLANGGTTLPALRRRARARPGDLALQLRLCRGYCMRGAATHAREHCAAVVRGDANNARGLAARALLYQGKFLYLRSTRESRRAVTMLRRLRRRFAKTAEARRAVFPLARALHRLGKGARARALLQRWARTAEQHNAAAWFAIAERAPSAWALAHARRAIAQQPKQPEHREALARLLALAGRRAAARAQWKHAVTLRPKSAYYRRMLAHAR